MRADTPTPSYGEENHLRQSARNAGNESGSGAGGGGGGGGGGRSLECAEQGKVGFSLLRL